ncbi:hypothetical protein [Rhodococcus sp. NPDC057529]|uniref:hypothetical protein n=1 Tax=Rhodococcus sp. NPDC057529 TaxID=3346158 RepID=UPI003672090A
MSVGPGSAFLKEKELIQLRTNRKLAAATAITVAGIALTGCSADATTGSNSSGSVSDFDATSIGVNALDTLYAGTESDPPMEAPKSPGKKVVYWISCGQQAPNCANKAAEGETAVKALGSDFKLVDGNLGIAGAYADAIRTAIAANADAIVQDAFPCTDVQQRLKEARPAGITVVGMDTIEWNTADYVPNGPWTNAFRSSLIKHSEATAVYLPLMEWQRPSVERRPSAMRAREPVLEIHHSVATAWLRWAVSGQVKLST